MRTVVSRTTGSNGTITTRPSAPHAIGAARLAILMMIQMRINVRRGTRDGADGDGGKPSLAGRNHHLVGTRANLSVVAILTLLHIGIAVVVSAIEDLHHD